MTKLRSLKKNCLFNLVSSLTFIVNIYSNAAKIINYTFRGLARFGEMCQIYLRDTNLGVTTKELSSLYWTRFVLIYLLGQL